MHLAAAAAGGLVPVGPTPAYDALHVTFKILWLSMAVRMLKPGREIRRARVQIFRRFVKTIAMVFSMRTFRGSTLIS